MKLWRTVMPVVLVGTLLSGQAGARALAPGAAEPPEFAELAAVFQRDYPGLTAAQARTAVVGQSRRLAFLERLGRTALARVGGGWYDPRQDRLHVRVLGAAGRDAVSRQARDAGVRVTLEPARYSYVDLEQRAAAVNRGLSRVELAADAWAVADGQLNRVVLSVAGRTAADSARARFANDPAVVVKEFAPGSDTEEACIDRYHCGAPARSGIAIGIDADGAGPGEAETFCSLGFTAAASDGSRWVVTAGHCSEGIATSCPSSTGCWGHGQQYFGPMRQVRDSGNVDVARIRRDNPYWTMGGYMFNAYNPSTTVNVDYAILSRFTIQVGQGVCLSAQYSEIGVACGTITTTSGYRGFIEVGFDACPGDSGGGWYWLSQSGERWEYGIHHGGDLTCHVAGNISRFTAGPDIYAYWDANSAATIRFEYR